MMTSRQMVIEQGLDYLRDVGSDQLCNICIVNGGSCCKGCKTYRSKVAVEFATRVVQHGYVDFSGTFFMK